MWVEPQAKATVGNDLIDLAAAHNLGRAGQPRFLQRSLTTTECDQLHAQRGGDVAFALLWSAKEAAYKAARKQRADLAFTPRRWQVETDSLRPPGGASYGTVRLDAATQVRVSWQLTRQWLHCIAVLGNGEPRTEHAICAIDAIEATTPMSERERSGCSCAESAAVRALARRLLQRHGIINIEILRATAGKARLPPRVCANGLPLTNVDLSLSHDGRYLAAVIATLQCRG